MNITEATLKSIAPRVRGKKGAKQKAILPELAKHINNVCDEFDITTPLRQAHFLAQLAHESDGFCTLEEYASGRGYEGRRDLGNTRKGDGVRFKGRGPIQLTGRANYAEYGNLLGLDLVSNPEQVASAEIGLRVAGLYWHRKGLNRYADRNNIKVITRKINGGYNGLSDRKHYFAIAAKELGVDLGAVSSDRLLKLGARGSDVKILQQRLNCLHYFVGKEDGIFGGRTDDQVRAFQRDYSLTIDGKVRVGGETWDEVSEAVTEGSKRAVFDDRAQKSAFMLASEGSRIAGASIKGAGSSVLSGVAAGSLALSEAAGIFQESEFALNVLMEPFGGPTKLALCVLVLAAGYSLWQHIQAARARAEDHQRGKTA